MLAELARCGSRANLVDYRGMTDLAPARRPWLSWRLSGRGLPIRMLLSRYLVAFVYLAGFAIVDLVYLNLSGHDQAALLSWASTDVTNLRHDPVGSLVISAFLSPGALWDLLLLIALAMFGANRAIGNWRLAVVCTAGQVVGTLVSEGIEYYRITHGSLPVSDALLLDVGPSYVVVAAVVVALIFGSWAARAAAALNLVLLVILAQIFSGLSSLQVAPVGHATSMAVAALLAVPLRLGYRRARARSRQRTTPPSGGQRAEDGDEPADHVLS